MIQAIATGNNRMILDFVSIVCFFYHNYRLSLFRTE